ncbi:MAG: PP2C family protein-serine/threonine phosphatase [Planctomycetota bacterium]|jgi:sigma-B regulation protein RsbU (phosphoserine phosphatase)
MIQPKDLYRELAALLANINDRSGEDDFLFSVLMKLENSFARDLHISNGRLYIEDLDRFLPVKPPDWLETSDSDGVIALDTEAVQHIMRNGSYIFNNPSALINNQTAEQGEYVIAAAFTVRNPENRWIIVFTLQSGWVREEVEFCLNAVRALLNFRLQSDAMKNDMQQAALIQQSLLPSSPPQIAGYETAGRSCPAEVVGGDFFDFSIFGDDVFSVAIGDASGHGLPAALLVRDVVTGLRMGVEKEMKMSEAMQKLNRVIHRSTLSARFISLFYAEIESNCNIFYVNAGHPPPLLVHGTQVTQLKATGTILGAVSEISLQRAFTCFEPGAVLVMYSDGLLERLNNDDEEFGLPRLTKLVVQHQQKSAQEIVDVIHQTVFDFGSQAKWQDDFTVVVVKKQGFNGGPNEKSY